MPKAYIAAPIFTSHQLAVVAGIRGLLGIHQFQIFSPYDASREIWKGRAPKDCTAAERQAVLNGNVQNLNHPTSLLLAWVGGTENGKVDTGVAWEMGYFHNRVARGDYMNEGPLPMALAYIDPQDLRQEMNLMLAGTVDAVARGYQELARAVSLYSNGRFAKLKDEFHPQRHVQQEATPIS